MIKEVIILAGGLGTRLRSVVADRPKTMAIINGKPFVCYLVDYLRREGIEKFIFSVGYMHEIVEDYIKNLSPSINYIFSREKEPLGTGGAIHLATKNCSDTNVLVCNGDTLFKIDIKSLSAFHTQKKAGCTLALKPMQDFDRYGVVQLNEDHSIFNFKEKDLYKEGLINGGVYVLHVPEFLSQEFPEKFSFEKEYLETKAGPLGKNTSLFGQVQDQYFIDIGIPADYERASEEIGV